MMNLALRSIFVHICKRFFRCCKILQHGAFNFISRPMEGAMDFYRPQKSSASARFEPANPGSSGEHANHDTTKATKWTLMKSMRAQELDAAGRG
jgi:hypothetical protein